MIKKITLVIVLLFFVCGIQAQSKKGSKSSKPQTPKTKQLPSLALGLGVLTFDGDIGDGSNLTSFSRIRGGYNATLEQRVGRVMGF